MSALLLTYIPTSVAWWVSYEGAKDVLFEKFGSRAQANDMAAPSHGGVPHPVLHAAAGGVAGFAAALVSNPMCLATTRLQTQHTRSAASVPLERNLFDSIRSIVKVRVDPSSPAPRPRSRRVVCRMRAQLHLGAASCRDWPTAQLLQHCRLQCMNKYLHLARTLSRHATRRCLSLSHQPWWCGSVPWLSFGRPCFATRLLRCWCCWPHDVCLLCHASECTCVESSQVKRGSKVLRMRSDITASGIPRRLVVFTDLGLTQLC